MTLVLTTSGIEGADDTVHTDSLPHVPDEWIDKCVVTTRKVTMTRDQMTINCPECTGQLVSETIAEINQWPLWHKTFASHG